MAVSKTKGAPQIMPTLEAGQRRFGENRVQEAAGKWPALRSAFPEIELHLIGPLQTNKVAEAVALFDAIETLDREKLARALAGEMAKQGRAGPALMISALGSFVGGTFSLLGLMFIAPPLAKLMIAIGPSVGADA